MRSEDGITPGLLRMQNICSLKHYILRLVSPLVHSSVQTQTALSVMHNDDPTILAKSPNLW